MKRRALFAALLALPSLAGAQSFLPPEDRVKAAISAYAEVRAADSAVTEAQAKARALRVGPHETQLQVIPQERRIRNGPTYREWDVIASRGIRLPGKAALDRETGDHAVAAAQMRQGDAEHQAARILLTEWMGWLQAETALTTARDREASLRRERDAVARRQQLGDASLRDVELIGAEVAQAEADTRQREADAAEQRLALRAGFPEIPLPERPPALPDPGPADVPGVDGANRIAQRSHEIGAAEETAKQMEAEARRARADRVADPTVGLRVFNERGGEERGIGVVLTVPIGGALRSAQAQEKAAAADGAYSQLDAVRRDIGRDARIVVERARAAVAQWQAARDARDATVRSTERTRKAYALGEVGMAELLLAERNAGERSLAEVLARGQAWEAVLRVRVDGHELWHEK